MPKAARRDHLRRSGNRTRLDDYRGCAGLSATPRSEQTADSRCVKGILNGIALPDKG